MAVASELDSLAAGGALVVCVRVYTGACVGWVRNAAAPSSQYDARG